MGGVLRRLVSLPAAACAVFLLTFAACSPPGGGTGGDGGPSHDRENTAGLCQDGEDNDGDGLADCDDRDCREYGFCEVVPDGGPDGDAGPCASVSVGAVLASEAVDIIWVIDTSGSMRGEASIVQDNLNAFAADISASGVDYRVVLITDPDFVTVPPPLGTDTAHFFPVHTAVRSGELLQVVLDQLPRFRSFLRPGAVTHLVSVTDDDSDLAAEDFLAQMTAALGHSFTAHAIASERAFHDCDGLGNCEPGCTGPNGDAMDIGVEYYRLAELTGGQEFSICTADWSGLFATLRDVVVVSATIPCAYDLPDPPEGMVFDPGLVNVQYLDDEGGTTVFARAMMAERCEDALAWHYDSNDAPTRIELCPAACELVEQAVHGRVDIALGCAPDEIIY